MLFIEADEVLVATKSTENVIVSQGLYDMMVSMLTEDQKQEIIKELDGMPHIIPLTVG